ncbi:hypothetical protein [Peribacillus asahii]|uniref:hypothetical protein n=1 Tax=Peribacillus asahii TaxID=228899 RepID=UPI00207A02C1|nr:hypothetical protein [Peribacillus asahii]USK86156.1 hypothetical protein LIT35_05810 [Peribacillus asahii]
MINIQNVANWLQSSFKEWLEGNTYYNLENVIPNASTIELEFLNGDIEERFRIELSEEEVEELSLIHEDINSGFKIKLIQDVIDKVYLIEENKIVSPILSDNQKIVLGAEKTKLKFITQDNSISTFINSGISLRLLYILVSDNLPLDFCPQSEDTEGYNNYLNECFPYFSYLQVEIENPTGINDDEKVNIFLNVLYDYNVITKKVIIPEGLIHNHGLSYFQLETDRDPIESLVPFNRYDDESIIYYLISATHNDFRFKYLDLYHVLEFYFDRSALLSIKNLLKINLSNPLMYFNDDEVYKLAKSLKEIMIVDRKTYKEEQSLLLVLKLIGLEDIMRNLGNENNNKFIFNLPEVKEISKTRLGALKIDFNTANKKYMLGNENKTEDQILLKLQERIYEIRNAIAHSKEEFEWRLKPNSNGVKILEQQDLELIKFLGNKIIHIFRKNKADLS